MRATPGAGDEGEAASGGRDDAAPATSPGRSAAATGQAAADRPRRRRGHPRDRRRLVLVSTRNQETTDDAFTDGNFVTIAPQVAGYVVELKSTTTPA